MDDPCVNLKDFVINIFQKSKKNGFCTPTPKMHAIQNANGTALRNYIRENMSRMYFMVKRAKRRLGLKLCHRIR